MHVFSERLSICVFPSVPFGFDGGMWDLVIIFPDHCLSIYLEAIQRKALALCIRLSVTYSGEAQELQQKYFL